MSESRYCRDLRTIADALAKASRGMDDILTATAEHARGAPLNPEDVWSVGPAIEEFKAALAAYEEFQKENPGEV